LRYAAKAARGERSNSEYNAMFGVYKAQLEAD
jgi:hypothetical protein